MKKIIFILSIVATVCCSCWKIDGFRYNDRESIYNSWKYTTQNVLSETVNLAFISNAWINGNDSVRRAIEDEYFPYTRIRHEGGNEYGIYEGTSLLFIINTGGKAIDEDDASWLITKYDVYSRFVETAPIFYTSDKHTRMDIRHTGDNEWNIRLDSATCDGSTSDWTISVPGTETPVSLFDTQYTLGGTGVYLFDGTAYNKDGTYAESPVTMRYTLTEPIRQQVDTKPNFEFGTVDMVVSKAGHNDITVRVEIFSSDRYRITQQQNGVTTVTNIDGNTSSTTTSND